MALKIKYKSNSGVEVTYWSVASYNIDKVNKTLTATLSGWISEKAKKTDKYCRLEFRNVICGQDIFDNYFSLDKIQELSNIETAIYKYAKENNEFFKSAEDLV